MIIDKKDAQFEYNDEKYIIGEQIIGNENSEYNNLVGRILKIQDGADKETENETPDIYCAFEPPVSPYDIRELEKTFSDLYETKKTLDDIALDMVIMSPDMIVPTRTINDSSHKLTIYTVLEDWSVDGENGCSTETYLDYRAAKLHFHNSLSEEVSKGLISKWSSSEKFTLELSADDYKAYLDGEYMENHYCITIIRKSVPVSCSVLREIGTAYTDECKIEDLKLQIEDWEEIGKLPKEKYDSLIADPLIPDMIEKKIGLNGSYWDAYWESVSEVGHDLLKKYKEVEND